jgi:NDP-sugar pyrophosphorylase family protein
MAGLGSRFKSAGIDIPKPLIKVNGKTLIEHSVESLGINANYIFITREYSEKSDNDLLTKELKRIAPESHEIKINGFTSGAAESCLHAKHLIDNNLPLIITNCDQIIHWDAEKFTSLIEENLVDGAVVLFKSSDPKNSFANIDNGLVTKIAEKSAISDNALIGLHYWKNGKDFVESAENLINTFTSIGSPECYISETYNYLIEKNKKIMPFFISKNNYISLGTPNDISIYLGKIKEYYTDKPKTIFCDIDGTILKHSHKFSEIGKSDPELLPGVIDKFNEWDSKGYTVVLTTARKKSARYITEKHLSDLGLAWDTLLMGVTSGERILINDKLKNEDTDRAKAINVITDSGFESISWEEFGL